MDGVCTIGSKLRTSIVVRGNAADKIWAVSAVLKQFGPVRHAHNETNEVAHFIFEHEEKIDIIVTRVLTVGGIAHAEIVSSKPV